MSPLLLKGLIGASAAGIIGTSGWGIFKFLEPKTIGEKLVSEGFSFPSMGDDSDLTRWKELAKKHKDNSTNADLKFTGLTVSGETATDEEARKFRDECKKLHEKGIGQADYEQDSRKLRQWCVVSPVASKASGQ